MDLAEARLMSSGFTCLPDSPWKEELGEGNKELSEMTFQVQAQKLHLTCIMFSALVQASFQSSLPFQWPSTQGYLSNPEVINKCAC